MAHLKDAVDAGNIVRVDDLDGERRPKHTAAEGVAAVVRSPGAATGLTQTGVHVRSIAPGDAGTNRHFHTVEEEWAYVLSGRGYVRIGPLRLPVRTGHFIGFPPGPRPHHFVNDGDTALVLLEGGESRAAEDGCWYPDARIRTVARRVVEPYVEPPPEEGDAAQRLHVDDVPVRLFQHDVEPRARRRMRTLSEPTGLTRQAVHVAEVEPGTLSTALHTHEHTDEWVYVLSGSAIVQLGERRFEIAAGDFVGHPAGSEPHCMEAVTELTYLVGGGRRADDVVVYPAAGLRRVGGRLEPLGG